MKRSAAVTLAVSAILAGSALTNGAAAVPDKKCQGGAENFQIVNGQCVSDGKAEKLNDRR